MSKCVAHHPTKQTVCRYDIEDHPCVHKDWEGTDFEMDMLADAMGVLCVRREGKTKMAEAPDSPERRANETPVLVAMNEVETAFWKKWERVY